MMPEFIREYISNQFSKPSGLFGRYIEKGMSKRTTFDAEWTISHLNIQPTSRLIEIGFGGGYAAQLASQQASQGFVAGIDHSDTMVQIASKRNAEAIKTKRMELSQGDAGTVPYPEESFDIVYSLHSIYFWNNPVECLKGFHRALKPSGLLAITIQPKNRWRDDQIGTPGMTFYYGDQILEMFKSAGYRNIRMESYSDSGGVKLQCILGNK
jgi:ubiquinone/menaquinone biosynthesis C-methylase UbiE